MMMIMMIMMIMMMKVRGKRSRDEEQMMMALKEVVNIHTEYDERMVNR